MLKTQGPAALFLITLLFGFSSGCIRNAADKKIAEDIQEKVTADPDTKEAQIYVATKGGKVTVVGSVTTLAARRRVEEIAQQEPGISGVNNQLLVEPGPALEPPPLSVASDTTPPAPDTTPEPLPADPPKPESIAVPAGTSLVIRTSSALGSGTSRPGQQFLGNLAQPVKIRGTTVFPAGSTVRGTVVEAKSKGKIKGEAVLDLELTSITARGQTYSIQTSVLRNTMKGKGKRTAVTTGAGAAGGGLIGGIAGGGKGAGIGGLVGAGAGLVGGAVTGNQQIEIPAESALRFRLAEPVRVRSAL